MNFIWATTPPFPSIPLDTGTLASLIGTHGYWVLALGCLLEGEAVLLMAGYAVHRGYLDPWWAGAIAASSGFLGDQFFFWLGRRHGAAVLARWPSWARSSARVEALLARYRAALVILVRFAYGLRIAGPVLIGAPLLAPFPFAASRAWVANSA